MLHTRRIRLVALSDEHLEHEVELDSDPEVMRYLGSGRARTREEVEQLHRGRLSVAACAPGLGFWAGFVEGDFVGWWILEPPERPDQGRPSSATVTARAVDTLATTAATVLAGVPEHLRALIPANLPPADQLAWFHTAKATGVFDQPAVPTTDTIKPAITPTTPDPASLPVFARMAGGYRK